MELFLRRTCACAWHAYVMHMYSYLFRFTPPRAIPQPSSNNAGNERRLGVGRSFAAVVGQAATTSTRLVEGRANPPCCLHS